MELEEMNTKVEEQVQMLSIEQILGWSMLSFHEEARKLVQRDDSFIARRWCAINNEDDVEKYEWQVFQDRAQYIHEILTAEFEAAQFTIPR